MKWILLEPALNKGCSASGLVRKLFLSAMDSGIIKPEMGSPVSFVRTDH